jgi:hypothetical protein
VVLVDPARGDSLVALVAVEERPLRRVRALEVELVPVDQAERRLDRVPADDLAPERIALPNFEQRDVTDVPVIVRGVELERPGRKRRQDVVTVRWLRDLEIAGVVRITVADLLDRRHCAHGIRERRVRSEGPGTGAGVRDPVRETEGVALLLVDEVQVLRHDRTDVGVVRGQIRAAAAFPRGSCDPNNRQESERCSR